MSQFKWVTTELFSIMDKTQNSTEAVFGVPLWLHRDNEYNNLYSQLVKNKD